VGEGLPALARYAPDATFTRNAIIGGRASTYPANNFFPATIDAVGFVDPATRDFRLAAGSPFRNAGTDGKDLGADLSLVPAWSGSVSPVGVAAPAAPKAPPNIVVK
jgi:hypothetical protein